MGQFSMNNYVDNEIENGVMRGLEKSFNNQLLMNNHPGEGHMPKSDVFIWNTTFRSPYFLKDKKVSCLWNIFPSTNNINKKNLLPIIIV